MKAAGSLIIVLARGGSKGLPGKNTRELAGKPCVMWTVEAALASRCAGMVVVSTDDARIASLARAAGAGVVERPESLASDTATIDDAARHAVVTLDQGSCLQVSDREASAMLDPVVILYGNVPVRPAGLIDRAVELCEQTGCDSVQSYAAVGKHHPWWTARVGDDGVVRPWEGEVINHGVYRRQDLPRAFVPDGGIIVVRRRALFLMVDGVKPGPHAFFGKDLRGVINPEGSVIDIDSAIDAIVAETVLKQMQDSK